MLGFAWLEEADGVVMQVRPRRVRERAGDELWTRIPEDDERLAAFLAERGFERDPFHALKMLRRLDDPLPQPTRPAGWTVREVGGREEWGRRIETHREVWRPSRVRLEAYRRLRTAPL